jgi:hypothetical protein
MTSRRGAKPDPRQGGLFGETTDPAPQAFSAADAQLRRALSNAIKKSGKSREQIAAEMEEVGGSDPDVPVSRAMLDAWTAPSRGSWRFPAIYLAAFIHVTGADNLLEQIVAQRGHMVLRAEDIEHVVLGRMINERDRLNESIRSLRKRGRE